MFTKSGKIRVEFYFILLVASGKRLTATTELYCCSTFGKEKETFAAADRADKNAYQELVGIRVTGQICYSNSLVVCGRYDLALLAILPIRFS